MTGMDAETLRIPVTRLRGRLAAFLDHDLVYSFLHSKVTVVATLVTLAIVLAAAFAPWIAPHDPFDLRELSLLDSHLPPAGAPEGDRRFLLGVLSLHTDQDTAGRRGPFLVLETTEADTMDGPMLEEFYDVNAAEYALEEMAAGLAKIARRNFTGVAA